MKERFRRAVYAIAAGVMLASPVLGATPVEFYHGRNIFVVIGYGPGGGYDLYARVLARHLGKHIPGNPTVIPQNMPGAGSLKAANYLYSIAPKDGSVIGTFAHGMGSAPLLGQAMFDARKFIWLGSITKDVMVCISWNGSPIRSWNDVMGKQFTFGGVAAGNAPDIYAKLYNSVLGARIKLATGFPGTNDIALAMQREEVDGLCGIAWSTVKAQHADWLRDKKIDVLLQAATAKATDLPNVPLASEFVRTKRGRQMLDFVIASQIMARPFVAPPGIPIERAASLRTAFDETMKDPAFLAELKKLMLDVDSVSGAEIDRLIAALYATPKDVVAEATSVLAN
jgi:tripartite-type tricarboxylate transporter receptor subunit TctC